MDHFKGVNETERYNNDLLNEIRKTNQLLERLILPIKPIMPTEKKPTGKKTQKRKKVQ